MTLMLLAAIALSTAAIEPAAAHAAGRRAARAGIVEYEAEDQKTSGTILGPDRTPGTLASEASGRAAVWLEDSSQFIHFGLSEPARGLTIRYSLPAFANGARQPARALLKADGKPLARVSLTSRYSASRQAPDGRSSDAPVHHFWDEIRILLPKTLPAGSTLSLGIAPEPKSGSFAVDLIDTVAVAPPARPVQGAISVQRFGADPTGRKDSRNAFIRAIAAARRSRRGLYVPPGRYRADGHLIADRVEIHGAGSWYSILSGHGLGFYARPAGSRNVTLSGLAIESDVAARQDRLPLATVGGRFSNSLFQGLYLHHAKVGMWLDGPAHGLAIRDVEIADQAADGINLHSGISNALVENNRIRNVGDDGIASWSDRLPNDHVRIRGNRITAIGLANGIALYGGHDIEVTNNRIADTLTEGGGIHLGTRFHSAPFSGTIRIADNLIVRSGSLDPHWHFGVGAIWLYALEKPIDARILMPNDRIEQPTCEAVQLLGPRSIRGVQVEGLEITGQVTSVLTLQTAGTLLARRVVTHEIPVRPIVQVPRGMTLIAATGNRGWRTRMVEAPDPPSCRSRR